MTSAFACCLLIGLALLTQGGWSDEFPIHPSTLTREQRHLSRPITLDVENVMGEIEIVAGKTNQLKIQALQRGNTAVFARVIEIEPDRYLVSIRYSFDRGIISNARHLGPREGLGPWQGFKPVHLRILISPQYLRHLSIHSHTASIKMVGNFSSQLAQERRILLESSDSDFRLSRSEMGQFTFRSYFGDLTLRAVRASHFDLNTKVGRLRLIDVTGNVTARNGNGQIVSIGGAGDFDARSAGGQISIGTRLDSILSAHAPFNKNKSDGLAIGVSPPELADRTTYESTDLPNDCAGAMTENHDSAREDL